MTAVAPTRRWSLTARLGWRLSAVMLAAILLAASAIAWRAIEVVHDLDDSALQSQAHLIVARLRSGPNAVGPLVLPDDLVAPFRASDGDNLFMVFDGDHMVAASDTAAAAPTIPLLPRQPHPGLFRLPPFQGHDNGMVGLTVMEGRWRIVVLQGREQSTVLLKSLIGNFLFAILWLLLPIGAATVLVGILTLRQGLRPIREASAAAAKVGPANPGFRLPEETLPREILPLVHAANQAVSRLEQALAAQRHFMAEAAHTLRTPLAVLTARLDILDDQPELAALRRDADRMGRLVRQMLSMARLEGAPVDVSEQVNLRAAAVEAIADLVPLGLQRGIEIALDAKAPGPAIRGNRAALVVAITNLVENALAHSPDGGLVEIAVGMSASIAVMDRGPGVPAAQRDRIFGRFERGAAPGYAGAGLGLAIVAEIAAAHQGTVSVADRPGGGAIFTLDLAAGRRPMGVEEGE